jgi:hypothetical protein
VSIRSCPFCKSDKITAIGRDTSAEVAYRTTRKPKIQIHCTNCRARGPIARTEAEAWDAWNGKQGTNLPLMLVAEEVTE